MSGENRQLYDTMVLAADEALANVHTATIAKVTAVGDKTISVKPVINRVVNGQSIELPVFTQVPPLFLQGGTSYTAHPIAVGDYCLLILTERCFDNWYDGIDFVAPAEYRMHDYSDGIAIVGLNPGASALTIPATIVQVGDAVYTGNLDITGNLTVMGNITVTGGDVVADGVSLKNHTHPGDSGGTTGPPN